MFEALVITLREGVEAALVLSIALTFLERRGLQRLRPALWSGTVAALAASVVAAVLAMRIPYNEELAEGVAMLIGAALVISLVWWMWIAAPHMKREVESGLERATRPKPFFGDTLGIFLFAFGMLFREGAETALFLSAASFTSAGVSMALGAMIGLALAVVFGVLVARGSLRVPLRAFFTVTSAVLCLIALQLLIGGFHELSEAGVLPSSRREMAIVGPLVKNEMLIFVLTVTLVAVWLMMGRAHLRAVETSGAAEARLARAQALRERSRRRWTGAVGLAVVAFLTTAFVMQSRIPPPAPAQPLAAEDGWIALDPAPLADGHLHFYQVQLENRPVRFFAVEVQGEIRACMDACEICGDKGYFEEGVSVVCRNCTSPIVRSSLGRAGGCNPIPLTTRWSNTGRGRRLEIAEAELRAALPKLGGR